MKNNKTKNNKTKNNKTKNNKTKNNKTKNNKMKNNKTKNNKTKNNKIKNNKIKNNKIFHFFEDHSGWMEGIKFSEDQKKIDSIMCTGNIVCHKTTTQQDNMSKKKYYNLLNRYTSKISNNNMVNFIKLTYNDYINYNVNKKNNVYNTFFDPDSGLTDEQMNFLMNPYLKDVIIGFDMDSTLHQTFYFINKPLNVFIKNVSTITKSNIKVQDIGEFYFGGKERLKKIKDIFQNLKNTIGINNVYIITANQSSLLREVISELYKKLFDIKLPKENIRVTIPKKLTKHDIILDILK